MQISAELTADEWGDQLRIVEVSNHDLRINQTRYTQGLALCATKVSPWVWAHTTTNHQLSWEDLPEWIAQSAFPIEIMLLGINDPQIPARFRQSQPKLQAQCAQRQIGLEVMGVASAARTYNILLGDGRSVIALFWMGNAKEGQAI